MKKRFVAIVLGICFIVSGCSDNSKESNSSIQDRTNSTTSDFQTEEINSSPIDNNNERKEEFDKKCKELTEQFISSIPETAGYSMQLTEPEIEYDTYGGDLSKIYVIKANGNGEDERLLIGYLDIFSDDEYAYFQAAKKYIEFIDENAIDISGRENYYIMINTTIDKKYDIYIYRANDNVKITYGDRHIHSAYSERLKNMDLFKECSESISLPGLVKFDDLPKDTASYEITVEYNGKSLSHKWYKLEDCDSDTVFVTYIDDGSYDGISDDELLYYAYSSIIDPQNKLNDYSFYDFIIAYKSGEHFAGSITYSPYFSKHSYATWVERYEHLNDNAFNRKLLSILSEGSSE
jgi:PBP1b-binding outer membrane lipoprotein LpoB